MPNNSYSCPEKGTLEVFIKERKTISRLCVLIEASKGEEDKLFKKTLKESFHAKSRLNVALQKIKSHGEQLSYLNDHLGNLEQGITILNNTASDGKADLFLNEPRYRMFVLSTLDNLLQSIDELKKIKQKHLKHCSKKKDGSSKK